MAKIKLEKATNDQWKIVSDFEKNAASKTFHPSVVEENETREFINRNKLFFITLGRDKIGIIAYQDQKETFYICEFVVGNQYQNKGYGQQALSLLLEIIGKGKSTSLYTHPENPAAIIVYLKAGFKIKGWKNNCYGDGEPRILLVKDNK